MNVCENEIRDGVEAELVAANEKHPPFASMHEAYGVIKEEFEEASDELIFCSKDIQFAWEHIRKDDILGVMVACEKLGHHAERLAQEACQLAAMAIKAKQIAYLLGQK